MVEPRPDAPSIASVAAGDGERWRRVRLAALADSPDAFARTFAEEEHRTAADWEQAVIRSVADANGTILLASADAGSVYVGLDTERPGVAHIGAMWVAPEHRGNGLASRLVSAAEAWAAARGAHTVELWATATNGRAIAFYRRVGYTETSATMPMREGSALSAIEFRRSL